jgi:L-cysteine:1D-myo-inositol 2-amino-2-deoxy-alpha-D-glucopyranoside ligase
MKSWPKVFIPAIDSRFNFPLLRVFNTSSQAVETLPHKEQFRMYVCGITPYDSTHLGHAATYLTFDLINRFLSLSGSKVNFVENITDIDDPLLERANRDGIDWKLLAQSQIELFRADMTSLRVIPPDHYVGAVESVDLVTKKIDSLKEAKAIYQVGEDLYFRVHADPDFGSRSNISLDRKIEIFAERGGDPGRSGKEDPLDALVWMNKRVGEPGWPSKYGEGRPGWHIECCAIALNYLEPDPHDDFSIDIQGGGNDLIFPHHEMSAAQARVATGKPFARMYVHSGMIGLDGEKMSKSLGNLVFVSTLMKSGVDPMAIRCALIMQNYQRDRMWNTEQLIKATQFLDELRMYLSRTECAPTDRVIQAMVDALSDNLDTERVFKTLNGWIEQNRANITGGNSGELARALDSLLGIAI